MASTLITKESLPLYRKLTLFYFNHHANLINENCDISEMFLPF